MVKPLRGNVGYVYCVIEPHGMRYKQRRPEMIERANLLDGPENEGSGTGMCPGVYMTAIYHGPVLVAMKPRVIRGHAASGTAATPPGRMTPQDELIFRDLMERFAVLSEMCFRFSQDIYLRTGTAPGMDIEETIRRNVSIARRVFGDRFLEILATIYLKKSVGVGELAATLGQFSVPELSRKLRVLESGGLVESGPSFRQPDLIRYSLTHKGTVIARLGEPVFLYLRLAEGWTTAAPEVRPTVEAHAADESEAYEATART